MAMTRSHGKRREHFYGCAYHHKRGATICPNNLVIRQELLDHAVLQAIHEVLDERIVEAAVDKALTRLRTGQARQIDRRAAVERELSLIEAQERRLVEAIKRGGEALDPLVGAVVFGLSRTV
jgi:Recombinase zinc beta ribbon domain